VENIVVILKLYTILSAMIIHLFVNLMYKSRLNFKNRLLK
jgi:hypothetical protein